MIWPLGMHHIEHRMVKCRAGEDVGVSRVFCVWCLAGRIADELGLSVRAVAANPPNSPRVCV